MKSLAFLRNAKAFTLIEILIGLSIAAVAGILLISLFSQNTAIFSDQSTKITQGLEINNAVPIIEESLKSGSGIVTQYPLTGQATYTTGDESIVISIPSLDAQGAVINNTYDYIVFTKEAQNSKILHKYVIVDPLSNRKSENQVLLTNLSLLEFQYLNSSDQPTSATQAVKIGYIINITDLVATDSKVSSVSGQINLRNN